MEHATNREFKAWVLRAIETEAAREDREGGLTTRSCYTTEPKARWVSKRVNSSRTSDDDPALIEEVSFWELRFIEIGTQGEVRSGIASLIEVFLRDVLRLEGKMEALVHLGVRVHVAEYERMFRDSQLEERNKDLATRVCRALCRRRVIKEMAKRGGTPTEAHLQIVLSAMVLPGFSSKDYADAPPLSPAMVDR